MGSEPEAGVAFDWAKVHDFSFTYHEDLLRKHGLADLFTMGAALRRVRRDAVDLLDGHGYTAFADWLRRELNYAHIRVLPEGVTRPVWERSRWKWDGEGPRRWVVLWDGRLDDLEYLDRVLGCPPRLWVLRPWLALNEREQGLLPSLQVARIFYHHPLLELPDEEPDEESEVWEDGWILGTEPSFNQWWLAETRAAASRLARLSPGGIEKRIRSARGMVPGGRASQRYWDVVYRKRRVKLPYAGNSDEDEEKHPTVDMQLPELGAIPFYHVDQLDRLHELTINGLVCFSLLSELSDADFKRGTIAGLRDKRGYPRMETRGRLKRDPALEERAFKLIREGLSKRRAAKELGVPRSSLYDILNAEEEGHSSDG